MVYWFVLLYMRLLASQLMWHWRTDQSLSKPNQYQNGHIYHHFEGLVHNYEEANEQQIHDYTLIKVRTGFIIICTVWETPLIVQCLVVSIKFNYVFDRSLVSWLQWYLQSCGPTTLVPLSPAFKICDDPTNTHQNLWPSKAYDGTICTIHHSNSIHTSKVWLQMFANICTVQCFPEVSSPEGLVLKCSVIIKSLAPIFRYWDQNLCPILSVIFQDLGLPITGT